MRIETSIYFTFVSGEIGLMIGKDRSHDFDVAMRLTEGADFVLLHFTDILGYFKGRSIPSQEIEKAFKHGVPFDGSSMLGGVNIEESDMTMKPDLTTFTVCPHYFYDKSVAAYICGLYSPEQKRFDSDPRTISQTSTERLRKMGYEPTAAAELEFYLVHRSAQGEIQPVENHLADRQRYFDISPGRDLTEPYRMELSTVLNTMGIQVEREHHEVGSAQNEITFRYSDPTTTSDNIERYKFAAKAIAEKKHAWTATFMPKPWYQKPGSGMHVHLGLMDAKNGNNPFYDPNGYASISQTARYFIGGILEHAPALSAIVAPSVNSYKRLTPGYEAPVYIAWSRRNRSALVRIPAFSSEKEARIEFRCPDALCNPYLAYSVIFEAGIDGIRNKLDPGDPRDTNLYHLTETERKKAGVNVLPKTLKEALEEWHTDAICTQALGKETTERYAELKTQEWKEYEPHIPANPIEVTPWEQQKYIYS